MKKFLAFITVPVISALLLSACGFNRSPVPEPTSADAVSGTSEPAKASDSAPEITPDPRDDEVSVRAEIEQKFKDIEDLIQEDMTDDAKMMIQNLQTFDLNEAEQNRLKEIQKRLVSVSD